MNIYKKIAAISAIATFVVVPMLVTANSMRTARYALTQDQVHQGNAYVAGEDMLIAGTVIGDLIAASNRILITGIIEDDVAAAGAQVEISGVVNGDARVVSSDLLINGDIGGDLAAAGGKIFALAGSTIGGDVWVAGGDIDIESQVYGDVRVAGGDLRIDGLVGGNVDAEGGQLVIGEHAYIQGTLSFRGGSAPVIAPGAIIEGGTTFTYDDFGGRGFGYFAHGVSAASAALWLIMSLVAALVLFGVFKKHATGLTDAAFTSTWSHVGRGFAVLILMPIASAILLATVIGMPIGIFGLLAYGIGLTISCALSGIVFGSWVARVVFKKHNYQPTFTSVIWGTVVLRLIALVPVVGWIVGLLALCVSLGVVSHAAYRHLWVNRHA